MEIAAFILEADGEQVLADWLLFARPQHARDIATAVAVHALRRNCPGAWDALVATDAADHAQAGEWYMRDEDFNWQPPAGWFEPTTAEMIAELERELKLRRRVYPRQIMHKMLSQQRADRQIAIIEAIIRRLHEEDRA